MRERPRSFRVVRGDLRQALLRDFPYAVVFSLDNDDILVAGVFHAARDRRIWDARSTLPPEVD